MSVRRPAPSRATPPGKVAPSRRLDAVLRAGTVQLLETGARVTPSQDTRDARPVPAWEDTPEAQQVQEAVTQARVAARSNRAALDRARAHNVAARRARAEAAATRVQILEMEARLAAQPVDARTSDAAAELARLREQMMEESRRADEAVEEARRASAELVQMRAQRDEAREQLRAAEQGLMNANAQTRSALRDVQAELGAALRELDGMEGELEAVRAQVRLAQTERDEEKERMVTLAGQLAAALNERDEARAEQLRQEQLAAARDEQRQREAEAELEDARERIEKLELDRTDWRDAARNAGSDNQNCMANLRRVQEDLERERQTVARLKAAMPRRKSHAERVAELGKSLKTQNDKMGKQDKKDDERYASRELTSMLLTKSTYTDRVYLLAWSKARLATPDGQPVPNLKVDPENLQFLILTEELDKYPKEAKRLAKEMGNLVEMKEEEERVLTYGPEYAKGHDPLRDKASLMNREMIQKLRGGELTEKDKADLDAYDEEQDDEKRYAKWRATQLARFLEKGDAKDQAFMKAWSDARLKTPKGQPVPKIDVEPKNSSLRMRLEALNDEEGLRIAHGLRETDGSFNPTKWTLMTDPNLSAANQRLRQLMVELMAA